MYMEKIQFKISSLFPAVILWLIALFILLPGITFSADDDFFLKQEIEVSGTVLGTRVADFNGDGRNDIAVIATNLSDQRLIHIYLQRDTERFPPTASQTIILSPSTNMVQAVDMDDDGRAELLTIDYDGLRMYHHDGERFKEKPTAVVNGPSIFTAGIEGIVLPHKFVYTISGKRVAMVPVVNGFLLSQFDGRKFNLLTRLNFPHLMFMDERPVKNFGSSGVGQFAMALPEIGIGDNNGDNLDDIYLVWRDRMVVFQQGSDGLYSDKDKVVFKFQKSSADNLCQAKLVDFDRDGRLDLVCSRSIGGVSASNTEIRFFGSDRFSEANPVQSHLVNITDACGNLMVDNYNKEGGLELVVPALELGTMSTVKMLITKKTDFHLLIYPIDNLGRPTREPQVRKNISCRLDFDKADPTESIRVNWNGDFDGDGLNDLVFSDGDGKLLFFRGSTDNYLEGKANLVLDINAPDRIITRQLNGDGRSDLIIQHKPGERNTRITLLVTNFIG